MYIYKIMQEILIHSNQNNGDIFQKFLKIMNFCYLLKNGINWFSLISNQSVLIFQKIEIRCCFEIKWLTEWLKWKSQTTSNVHKDVELEI